MVYYSYLVCVKIILFLQSKEKSWLYAENVRVLNFRESGAGCILDGCL